MAKKTLSNVKIVGLALTVVGIGLAIWGYQLSGSVGSQLTQAMTGSNTDKVMMLYISGAAGLVVGLFLFLVVPDAHEAPG